MSSGSRLFGFDMDTTLDIQDERRCSSDSRAEKNSEGPTDHVSRATFLLGISPFLESYRSGLQVAQKISMNPDAFLVTVVSSHCLG